MAMLKKIKRATKQFIALPRQLYYRLSGSEVQCNICGYRANRLASDSWHPYTFCQGCGSEVRHRLLWAAITTLPALNLEQKLRGKIIIHFAPEPYLQKKFKKISQNYRSADFFF